MGCIVALVLASCGISRQTQQLKALEKCDYKIVSANNITVAGTDVRKLINEKSVNLANIPSLALGYLRKDIPLKANLMVEITNPSTTVAAINNFDYIIQINQQELVNGTVNQRVQIDAGQSARVPVQLNVNIYQFLSNNNKMLDDISAFLGTAGNGNEKKGLVTLKIRPSIMVGGQLVKYPSYITINKEVSSKMLL